MKSVDQRIRKSLRSKDGPVFYPAHNPKVVSSNLTLATIWRFTSWTPASGPFLLCRLGVLEDWVGRLSCDSRKIRGTGNRRASCGSIQPSGTNLTDSPAVVGCLQQSLPFFGKDLGKKSLSPYQSQAVWCKCTRSATPHFGCSRRTGRIEGSVTKVVADMGRPLVEDSRSALSWITSQYSTKVPSLA